MSSSVRKVRQGEKLPPKTTGIHSQASHDLRRLRSLLAKTRREMGASGRGAARSRSGDHQKDADGRRSESEASELEKFSVTYRDQRCFSRHPLHGLFSDVLVSLVKNRLCSEWIDHAAPESALRVLICLRILVRDPQHQEILHQLQGISLLARHMESVTATYASCGDQAFSVQQLVTMTYMFQKLSAVASQRAWVIESGAHKTLARLLSTTDSGVLLGALLALSTLAESPEAKEEIGELAVAEHLLVILQEYDLLSKRMSAELLRLLSPVRQVREQVRELGGLPLLLSLLHGPHLKLLWSLVWVLVQLCQDPEARAEIRSWGGVQLLLRLLDSDRRFVGDRSSSIETLASADVRREPVGEEPGPRGEEEEEEEEEDEEEKGDSTAALQSACCAALAELSLDDAAAHRIVQENGVHVIAKLILPQTAGSKVTALQCYAFRSLRFLFSVERSRHLFKRLFPTDLLELFIDVGHFVRDLAAYEGLRAALSLYTAEELDGLRASIQAADQNRPPLRVINGFSVLDHLGTGAFGSVFKVRKQSGQNLLALKEVNLRNPAFGKDKRSRDSNVEKIVSELTIIREQMTHPNVVKYYRTFVEGEKLYIVMELIEGVPLAERFASLKEKQQRFTEDRIWNIFIQMCLALRYLHKEKRIVHRDLTPSNIMLGETDKVTITDFGLAKQKQESSKLTSVVGTILYSCPEVVKSEPYGEKADVWALGCVLYQMATLRPPFYSANMLSLASKIVEAVYEPVEAGVFSQRVTDTIRRCLSPDPEQRPDVVAVSAGISDLMMRLMDGLYASQNALERRAERDRKRAQRYFLERHKGGTSCCLSDPPQEPPAARSSSAASDRGERTVRGDLEDDVEHAAAACAGVKSTSCGHVPSSGDYAAAKTKPRPASAGICVSHKKLRQIDDPSQRLLEQLHKIVFISQVSQLPPAPHHGVKRRLVERFKKSLFRRGSDPSGLKTELGKLLQASPEPMELGPAGSDWWPLARRLAGAADGAGDGSLGDGVTYQQMQAIVEELLDENSYYRAASSRVADDRRPRSSS